MLGGMDEQEYIRGKMEILETEEKTAIQIIDEQKEKYDEIQSARKLNIPLDVQTPGNKWRVKLERLPDKSTPGSRTFRNSFFGTGQQGFVSYMPVPSYFSKASQFKNK